MAHPTVVIDVVGLTSELVGSAPRIAAFAGTGRLQRLRPVLPAVTCAVQSSMLTGLEPADHGIVGNGWYDRESAEVRFWKQSNHLVAGERVWETARSRDPSVTTCTMFWWFNMYSSAEYSVTPRPIYAADGRKIPDVYSEPAALRDNLQERLGRFPLFHFWGPASSIVSSRWIADASMLAHELHHPTLTMVYLPHLDYALQRLGPDHPEIAGHVAEIDTVVGSLIDYFEAVGARVVAGLTVDVHGAGEVRGVAVVEPVVVAEPAPRLGDKHEVAGARMERLENMLDAVELAAQRLDPAEVRRVGDVDMSHLVIGHSERPAGPGIEQLAAPLIANPEQPGLA